MLTRVKCGKGLLFEFYSHRLLLACERAAKRSGEKSATEASRAWPEAEKGRPLRPRSPIFFFAPLHLGGGPQASLLLIVSVGFERKSTEKH